MAIPGTTEQAEWLREYLDRHVAPLHCVINLIVPDDLIIERLSKRRINIETGENFHLDFKPPPADIDPAVIIQREDDKPEAIKKRLKVYAEETHPLVDYYTRRNLLVDINGVGAFQEVHNRIVDAVYSNAST